ncbi:penicillin acylase family protein [Daejeonella oryzae]|uniref:penicillin acylase family protein n=1 Tax=Daejeonella oryzae TaxID=1122943 RepID=UPI001C658821|nr:penicillin acylase family protein [Daejeonella oryzae]
MLCGISSAAQTIDPQNVQIARDSWGVPHIFGKTDADVAYGLAWAHSEDDFATIQTSYLAGKGILGLLKGKEGLSIDYVVQLLRARELVEARYETDISSDYKKVLEGYVQGFNSYAAKHPNEVLVKRLFPVSPKDILTFSVLQLCVLSGADQALKSIFDNSVLNTDFLKPGGSNAYAFNSNKTADGSVYLNINSHQPLEGPVSWYEAHLNSEEGWNILGALFPGAPSILHGVNENLGWAHTVNYPDKVDTYQLEMNPKNRLQYKFDGNWINLEVQKAKLKFKLAGIPLGITKKTYWSKYGPTVITKKGTYSIRLGAQEDIRGLEEWYRMNKARNFTEFKAALDMGAIPGYNVVYADKFDTIYYLSNGKLPVRDSAYNWIGTLPGNTSKTLWTTYHPVADLPQVLNPPSGYLFNSNHSPFNATAKNDNIKASDYDQSMNYETYNNNRSNRFMELISSRDKISYSDFKQIKYDLQLPQKLAYAVKLDSLFMLDEKKYPAAADLINLLNSWDKKADTLSAGATVFVMAYTRLKGEKSIPTIADCYRVLLEIKSELQQNFKAIHVPLGQYQRLVRGNKSLAVPGLPDVIASMESEPFTGGRVKARQGESYIELVRFTKDGPEIETINCYGASNNPGTKHYDDQMELFVQQKTKKMTLNKEQVLREAVKVYHPR